MGHRVSYSGPMFAGITHEHCVKAWEMVLPGIVRGAEMGLLRDVMGGMVVLNPADAEGEPLFTAGLGDEGEKYIGWATHKARVAARERTDTSRLRQDFPYLYRAGDIKWPGGLYRGGLALGFSGVQGEYDEMICEWMAAAIRAMTRIEFAGAAATGGPFLGVE